MTKFTKQQIDAAIEAETKDWAEFFNTTDLEARRNLHRANIAVGYFKPLMPYLIVDGPDTIEDTAV